MPTHFPSIAEVARQFRHGDLTPVQLVEATIKRIHSCDPRVHAWVFVDEEYALNSARLLGDLLRSGTDLGPLHGIPVGIKDIVDVAGWPTLAGSRLRAGHVAQQDAEIVARLRRCGAVILGKTVTTEFACFDPSPTKNPWNLQHTPGGSSSGSAAAMATEMGLLAIGSQTGGSITRPASYCGVAGLKPTHGVLPLQGIVPISSHLDHPGPIARCVADLAIGFAALSNSPRPNFTETLESPIPASLAVIEPYFLETADAEVARITIQAIEKLRLAGAQIFRIGLPPSFEKVHVMHRRLMAIDAAAYHNTAFVRNPDGFGPHIGALIREGLKGTGVEYSEALQQQKVFRDEMRSMIPSTSIAVTPATTAPAPASLESTGDPRFNSPWSFAGFPTVSIPCGLSSDGMPCGLQFVGRPCQDWDVIAAANWCERMLGFEGHKLLL